MTRPAKTRAWTKRDQKERLAHVPVVLSEPMKHVSGGHWLWRHWCPWCKCHHHHSPMPGHRAEHCTVENSPFKATGYILKLDPTYAERDRICRLERREAELRKELIGFRKAAWAASEERRVKTDTLAGEGS
jgi:hypothetical protein